MNQVNPIKDRQPISRFKFRDRPVPAPGTALVYQMTNGSLVATKTPFSYNELLWRKPREYFVVDVAKHTDSFSGSLPSNSLTLEFTFTVNYEWRVGDTAAVVREAVDDVPSLCRKRMRDELPRITRGFDPLEVKEAEEHLNTVFQSKSLDLEAGIGMTVSRIDLRLPREHQEAATVLAVNDLKTQALQSQQASELSLHKRKVEAFMLILEGGEDAVVANMLASDPDSAREVAAMTIDKTNARRNAIIELAKTIADNDLMPPGQAAEFIESATRALSETLESSVSPKGSIGAAKRKSIQGGEAESREPAESREGGES